MIEPLIFTLDDIQSVRKVSVNIADFDLYANEVQQNFLSEVLGNDLYLALVDDLLNGVPQTQRFIDLVNGKRYTKNNRTEIFRGVKRYCIYTWLYVYPIDSDVNITPIGAMMFKDEEAEHVNNRKSNHDRRNHMIKQASLAESNIIDFLNDNRNDYPEYDGYSETPAENSDFEFKVIGNSYTTPDNYISGL